jgi:3'-phosphoadenosine 5'-phosphosulfate sulfotransferase (PAPS reductase)/FAD synthetase
MRNVEVSIFNRKALGSHTTTIHFDTIQEFMEKCDSVIDLTDFYKVYLEFDTDEFTNDEIELLKKESFI